MDVLPWAGSLESAHGYGWLAPPSGPTRGSAAAAARDDHGHLNLRRKDDDATMRDRVLDYVSVLWPSRALRSGAVDDWLAPLGGTVVPAELVGHANALMHCACMRGGSIQMGQPKRV